MTRAVARVQARLARRVAQERQERMSHEAKTEAEDAMTPTELMETYLHEVGGAGRLDLIETLAQDDMIDEANRAFGGPEGRAGLLAHVKGFRRAIGDVRYEIGTIAAGTCAAGQHAGAEEVMAAWRFSGRHEGDWLGRKASGGPVSGDVISIFTLRGGLIAHYRLWLCAAFGEGAARDTVVFDSGEALRAVGKL
ncbi:ester cyclase [Rhodobacteraceae bacterium D3-12]|nr:ester cyclase [Rhodobacteraceae bacterium D3-12]